MTQTTRRTTKITSAPRGYVAVHVDYIAATTTRIACVARQAMTITGVNGASVELKAGEAFTLVRSESLGANMFYIVREVVGEKRCSCPANKPCKHETGLAAHVAKHGKPAIHLRATRIAAEASKVAAMAMDDEPAIVGSVTQHIALDDDTLTAAEEKTMAHLVSRPLMVSVACRRGMESAPLNGNRGFSLLRR